MITGTNGTMLSMTYRKELELVFDVAVFKGIKPTNSPIDLWYIAANRERDPKPFTPEKEFFIQCIRDQIRGLDQSQTKFKELLDMVSAGWKKANYVSESMRLVDCTYRTKVTKTSDSSIAFRAILLVSPVKTRVDVTLNFHGRSTPNGVEITIEPEAQVVYGEQFKVDNVVEFLKTRIGTRVITKEEQSSIESWSDVIVELQERLVAKAKAQQK